MGVVQQKITDNYSIYNGDCCEVLPDIPDDSIGFSVFSPPFSSLYVYTDLDEDMGNNSREQFFEQFAFLVKELERVMMPGRIVAVHCMELPTHKRNGEAIGVWDFPGEIVRSFVENGFIQHGPRITIWKDPLVAATRTKSIGLAHKQIVKDSTICRTGLPDYVIPFRKNGDNPIPVAHPNGLTEYHGGMEIPKNLDRFIGSDVQGTNKRSHWIWQQYASPVWFDIRQTRVLPFREARDGDDERHICPLQLDVVERCIELWTVKGDIVLTPFLGVGSEAYVAVKNGRRAIGVELKKSYYQQALANLESLKRKKANKGFQVIK